MPSWLLIAIFIWVYLCFGFGILLFTQLVASKTDDEFFSNKVMLDIDNEADQTIMMLIVLFWPVASIISIFGIIV